MIKNPIQNVSHKLQYRAIGIIYGSYKPNKSKILNKGFIKGQDGIELESVVLGKALPLIKKHVDFNKGYYWIVYPRNKNTQLLHLQILGIWDPHNLSKENKDELNSPLELLKAQNLKDNYFSVRGKLIFINIPQKEILIKIFMENKKSFKVVVKGEIPMEYINYFVSLNIVRIGKSLQMEDFEVIEEISS